MLSSDHVDDGGQFVEIDKDCSGNVLGKGPCSSYAHGDQFANLSDFVVGQDGLFRVFEPSKTRIRNDWQHTGQICSDKHRTLGLHGFFDRAYFPMSNRAPNERDILHASQAKIGDILTPSAQESIILFTQN